MRYVSMCLYPSPPAACDCISIYRDQPIYHRMLPDHCLPQSPKPSTSSRDPPHRDPRPIRIDVLPHLLVPLARHSRYQQSFERLAHGGMLGVVTRLEVGASAVSYGGRRKPEIDLLPVDDGAYELGESVESVGEC
jgi:hypothetical protein